MVCLSGVTCVLWCDHALARGMSQVNVWVGLERACVERYSGHTGLPTGKNLRKMKRSSRQRHY